MECFGKSSCIAYCCGSVAMGLVINLDFFPFSFVVSVSFRAVLRFFMKELLWKEKNTENRLI